MESGKPRRLLKPLNWYKSLGTAKERQEACAFLVEGERAVQQITVYHAAEVIEILAIPEIAGDYTSFPVRQLTATQISSLSSSKTPQGIMAVVQIPKETSSSKLPQDPGTRVLLLEHVQDPGNLGTIIRTAAAFGFSGIIMSDKTADPFAAKVVQSTAGSVLSLWIRRTADYLALARSLSSSGYEIAAADLNGACDTTVLQGISKLVLALGNEAAGLGNEVLQMASCRVKIAIDRSRAESLNVAISGAILMYLAAGNA